MQYPMLPFSEGKCAQSEQRITKAQLEAQVETIASSYPPMGAKNRETQLNTVTNKSYIIKYRIRINFLQAGMMSETTFIYTLSNKE